VLHKSCASFRSWHLKQQIVAWANHQAYRTMADKPLQAWHSNAASLQYNYKAEH